MTADARRTALSPLADRLTRVEARKTDVTAQVSVRVDGAVATELGLPTTPNTWSRIDEREALWLGPDEWLVVSEGESAGPIVDDLGSRLTDRHASIVDVSAARVAMDLTGRRRFDLLAAGCGLDLHPRSWQPGMCAQTLLARVAVLLQERDDATRVFIRPSFAGYLVTWFSTVTSKHE